MELIDLLQSFISVDNRWMRGVSDLTIDSREVEPGWLFLAYPGLTADGRDYIQAAVKNGADAVLAEGDVSGLKECIDGVPIFTMPELQQKVSAIANTFFGFPSKRLHVIGVTGTNGKTSIAYYLVCILNKLGMRTGYIGTLGYGFESPYTALNNTTPDAITTQRLLADFRDSGASHVVIEASSHALHQHRLSDVLFKTGVFTNLSWEHIDYHGTMEAYGEAKAKLFTFPSLQGAVINVDDNFGQQLIARFNDQLPIHSYSINGSSKEKASVQVNDFNLDVLGLRGTVQTPWGEGEFTTPLLGEFNLSNLLAVVTVLGQLGISLDTALEALSWLTPAPGRMELVSANKMGPMVVVDFAHTPDALEKALCAGRAHTQGELICIFGCGGERDKEKRPQMGQVAERLSDHLVITNDNPRTEAPEGIIHDIMSGLKGTHRVELDRKKAIALGIGLAKPGDMVLIAGKGHETYQQIGREKLPFNDVECAKEFLKWQAK